MGTLWRRSGSFEFDASGERAGSAQAFFFQGGTTTPLTVYEDPDLTTAHDTPVVASGVGRWPAVYIDYIESYDEKIEDSRGDQLTYYTEIANVDPTFTATPDEGSPNALQTGQWIFSDVDETKTGFVRANGRTIGSASSGASERAHADCEALFLYRWNKIGNGQAPVSGGRGASGAADWAANKTIGLPDCKGGGPIGLSTMGAASDGSLASAPFAHGGSATPGSLAGLNTHTLTTAQLPVVTPAGTIAYVGNFTPAGTISYAGNFTPAGSIGYAGNFTPAGSITYAGNFTPAGTVTKPNVTITDGGHTHGLSPTVFSTSTNQLVNVAGAGSTYGSIGAIGLGPTSVDTTGVAAALDATPTFTGTAAALPGATFAGTSAALPAATFTGTSAALPAATFTGTAGPVPAATFTGTSFGSDGAHNNVSKSITGTFYIKL